MSSVKNVLPEARTDVNTVGLERLLNPKSIAIVGATADPRRVGGVALSHLVNFKFQGNVYPVNRKYETLHGLPCYANLASLPEVPDVAVLSVSADRVLALLQECHAKGIKAAIVYAAGFAEAGEQGAVLQDQLQAFVRSTGMLLCGPNCMGLANLNTRAITAFATLFDDYPPSAESGNVSLVTQSGNVCIVLYATGIDRGINFHHFINTGNEATLEFSDYLEYLAEDDETETVVGYMEGLRDGYRFIEAASLLRKSDKPLILLKGGESEKGSEAALSHTASLAGNAEVNRAAFQQLGIMQARDPIHLVDLAYLANSVKRKKTAGCNVAVVSISGAMGALLTDLLVAGGSDVPELEQPLQNEIVEQIPGIGMVSNPIDTTAQIYNKKGVARSIFRALGRAKGIDAVVVYATGYLLDKMATELMEASADSDRMFVVIDTGKATRRDELEKSSGIPVFTDIARATNALSTYLSWRNNQGNVEYWNTLRTENTTVSAAHFNSRLDEHEAKLLLAKFGVPIAREDVARTAEDAITTAKQIGYPVALKLLSPDIVHKSEVRGVSLHLATDEDVSESHTAVIARAKQAYPTAEIRGSLIQKMEVGVCELIVGITRDPIFGLSMTVGLGGVMTELIRDTSHRLLPVDETIAYAMLRELRTFPLLNGFRGSPVADISAACSTIAAISRAATAIGSQLQEMEINPLLIKEVGNGTVALDAFVKTID